MYRAALALCLGSVAASCGDVAGETATASSSTSEAESSTTGPSCSGGEVYVEPDCNDGDTGTFIPIAGCRTSCTAPGRLCGDMAFACLPVSVRTCACPDGGDCCPECRGIELVCLERALFTCDHFGDAEDCEALLRKCT